MNTKFMLRVAFAFSVKTTASTEVDMMSKLQNRERLMSENKALVTRTISAVMPTTDQIVNS